MSKNMEIWNRNKTIDSKYTKQATVSGQKITSFSLQSVIMLATQEFGPFGKGWGYEVEQERFDEGAIIQEQVTHENGEKREANRLHVSKIRGEAKDCLMLLDFDEAQAEKIVLAISGGQIKNVQINY